MDPCLIKFIKILSRLYVSVFLIFLGLEANWCRVWISAYSASIQHPVFSLVFLLWLLFNALVCILVVDLSLC